MRQRRSYALSGTFLFIGGLLIFWGGQKNWFAMSFPNLEFVTRTFSVQMTPEVESAFDDSVRQASAVFGAILAVLGLTCFLVRNRWGTLLRVIAVLLVAMPAFSSIYLYFAVPRSFTDMVDPSSPAARWLLERVDGVAQRAGMYDIHPTNSLYITLGGLAVVALGVVMPSIRLGTALSPATQPWAAYPQGPYPRPASPYPQAHSRPAQAMTTAPMPAAAPNRGPTPTDGPDGRPQPPARPTRTIGTGAVAAIAIGAVVAILAVVALATTIASNGNSEASFGAGNAAATAPAPDPCVVRILTADQAAIQIYARSRSTDTLAATTQQLESSETGECPDDFAAAHNRWVSTWVEFNAYMQEEDNFHAPWKKKWSDEAVKQKTEELRSANDEATEQLIRTAQNNGAAQVPDLGIPR